MNQMLNMNNANQMMMNSQNQNNNMSQINQMQMDDYQRMMQMNQMSNNVMMNNNMGNFMNNNMNNNMAFNIKDVEIEKLRNELANANNIIEQQKITINNLQIELSIHLHNTNSLQNIINQKELEINNLKLRLNNNNIQDEKLYKFDDIKIVTFISTDSKVHFGIKCVKNNTFAEIEEKLYREYPEYRETNNSFVANGNEILRFKTIEENNIGNGSPVTLMAP